jgi:hypothetical protein
LWVLFDILAITHVSLIAGGLYDVTYLGYCLCLSSGWRYDRSA